MQQMPIVSFFVAPRYRVDEVMSALIMQANISLVTMAGQPGQLLHADHGFHEAHTRLEWRTVFSDSLKSELKLKHF